MMKEYHIYFKERCIFKQLSEGQFEIIWPLLNKDYNSELTFSEFTENPHKEYEEASY